MLCYLLCYSYAITKDFPKPVSPPLQLYPLSFSLHFQNHKSYTDLPTKSYKTTSSSRFFAFFLMSKLLAVCRPVFSHTPPSPYTLNFYKCLCTSLSTCSKAGKSLICSANELFHRPLYCGKRSLSFFLGKSAACKPLLSHLALSKSCNL